MNNEVCQEQERTISTSITELEKSTTAVKELLGLLHELCVDDNFLKTDRQPIVIEIRDRLDAIGRDLSMIIGNLQGM